MTGSANTRIVYVLAALLVVALAALAYQHRAIQVLEQRVMDTESAVAAMTRQAAAARERAESQAARIKALETAPDPVTGMIPAPTALVLATLEPGFYELSTETPYDPASDEPVAYEISHAVIEFDYDTYSTRLNVGIARSGTWSLPIGIYFDYNGDGRIDSDMAMKFAGDIPLIGGVLRGAYRPVISQNLYSIFVNEAPAARHVSLADIAEDAGAASNRLWTFLQSQYETIEAWVSEHLPRPGGDSEDTGSP